MMLFLSLKGFSLSLAAIYQIRYSLAYVIPIPVKYFFLNCWNLRWQTTITLKTFSPRFSIDVLYLILKHSFISYLCFTVQ